MRGSGTQADPYIIDDATDLQNVNNDLTAYYELGGDIDASATSGWNGGQGFIPIATGAVFKGQLDGKGYTISDLYINRALGSQGLIADLDADGGPLGIVKNVSLTGLNINGRSNIGGIAALLTSGTIERCTTDGSLTNTGIYDNVGGIVGRMSGGTITECGSSCTITVGDDSGGGLVGYLGAGNITKCYATGDISVGDDYGGGLIGRSFGIADIDDCYATGDVTVIGDYSGGFIGYSSPNTTIDDCYSTGTPSGAANVGGFCGDNDGTITNCFWDTETSGQAASSGGTGKTTSEMKSQSTFTDAGWDFTTIWNMKGNVNNGYPQLIWAFPVAAYKGNINIDQLIYQHAERMRL